VKNLAVARYDLSGLTDIANAKLYDCGRYGPVFFYATDRNIYACSLAATPTATQINEPFGANETITAMMVYNPNTTTASGFSDVAGTLLYVATWDGTEGKVYEFAITRNSGLMDNATSNDPKAPLNVFGGMGKVVSLCVKLEGLG
jgi:hypothetical protein